METGSRESTVNKKLLALVAIVLALLMVAICYVGFLLVRSMLTVQPAQQQLAQPEVPLPASVTSGKPVALFLPVVVNLETPAAITVPTSTLWRFVSIDEDDIATFENVGDPNQRLAAKCIDPKRPTPDEGALYELNDAGILKSQEESKKFQRFEIIAEK